MKLGFNHITHHSRFIGVVFICAMTAVSCTKKNDNEKEAEEAETTEETVQIVDCDDNVALSQLSQSIKSNLTSKTHNLFNSYAESSGETLDLNNLNSAVGSILIDVANPTVLQEANSQGMVTCNASLSLTLPNKDINRATSVYSSSEDKSLQELLQADNITLNNNMLVSNNFSYVVGMQGGKTSARVVGQPAILSAVADIIAKSQYQSKLDEEQAAANVVQSRPAPRIPAQPKTRPEPQVRTQSNQSASQGSSQSSSQSSSNSNPSPSSSDSSGIKNNDPSNNGVILNDDVLDMDPAVDFEIPEDENIEMVIIQEEGTY